MARIAEFTVPAAEFVLGGTLGGVPDVRVEAERVVSTAGVTPYVRATGDGFPAFERALDRDPTVADAEAIGRGEGERFYRIAWTGRSPLGFVLANTDGSLLRAVGEDGTWRLRVLFPDQRGLTAFNEFCTGYGVDFTLVRLFEPGERTDGRYDLTPEQFEVLVAAVRNDYFAVPRGITLSELADDLGISTQAASKRLRRGHESLVRNALLPDG